MDKHVKRTEEAHTCSFLWMLHGCFHEKAPVCSKTTKLETNTKIKKQFSVKKWFAGGKGWVGAYWLNQATYY